MGRVKKEGRYHRRLLQLFAMHDEPLSHHDILTLTNNWKHGLTSPQLANVLSKDPAFEFYDVVKSGRNVVTSQNPDGYDVNRYLLSPLGEELAAKYPPAIRCEGCSDIIYSDAIQRKQRHCGPCYMQKKREERANAKA